MPYGIETTINLESDNDYSPVSKLLAVGQAQSPLVNASSKPWNIRWDCRDLELSGKILLLPKGKLRNCIAGRLIVLTGCSSRPRLRAVECKRKLKLHSAVS